MSKSIFNKDWEDLIKNVDDKTRRKLIQYDDRVSSGTGSGQFIICNKKMSDVLQFINDSTTHGGKQYKTRDK